MGQWVSEGQIVAEVVDIENPDEPRVCLVSKTNGLIFARCLRQLVTAGQIVAKVSGPEPLPWRVGNLLTA